MSSNNGIDLQLWHRKWPTLSKVIFYFLLCVASAGLGAMIYDLYWGAPTIPKNACIASIIERSDFDRFDRDTSALIVTYISVLFVFATIALTLAGMYWQASLAKTSSFAMQECWERVAEELLRSPDKAIDIATKVLQGKEASEELRSTIERLAKPVVESVVLNSFAIVPRHGPTESGDGAKSHPFTAGG